MHGTTVKTIDVVKSEQKCRALCTKNQVGFIVVGDKHSPKHAFCLMLVLYVYCYQRHVANQYTQKALLSSTVIIVT
jgi:hypothetical protein